MKSAITGPLAHGSFRWLLLALVLSAIGSSIQDVGSEWLLTSQTLKPLQVALLVMAIRLPRVVLGIPAGVISDLLGSRRSLLLSQAFMLAVMLLMTSQVAAHAMTAWTLLILTFLLYAGMSVQDPAMFSGLLDLVPRSQMASALSLQLAGYALARLVGPLLGGALIQLRGPVAAFAINALCFSITMTALFIYRGRLRHCQSGAQRGALGQALRDTLSVIRSSRRLHGVLLLAVTMTFCATAQYALFPVLARTTLKLDSSRFGLALSCLNAGAIVGTLLAPQILSRVSYAFMLSAGFAVAGAALLLLTRLPPSAIFGYALVFGTAIAVLEAGLLTAAQACVPAQMSGRVIGAMLTACAVGSSAGSVVWGSLATAAGIPVAVGTAGAVYLAVALVAYRSTTEIPSPEASLAASHLV